MIYLAGGRASRFLFKPFLVVSQFLGRVSCAELLVALRFRFWGGVLRIGAQSTLRPTWTANLIWLRLSLACRSMWLRTHVWRRGGDRILRSGASANSDTFAKALNASSGAANTRSPTAHGDAPCQATRRFALLHFVQLLVNQEGQERQQRYS